MSKSNESKPAINNNFIEMLKNHRDGQIITELSEALAKVSEAALLTGRAGNFGVIITVKPAGKTAGAIVFADDIKTKLPKADKAESIFYYEDGAIFRDNPRQMKMDLKTVPGGKAEEGALKEVVAAQA